VVKPCWKSLSWECVGLNYRTSSRVVLHSVIAFNVIIVLAQWKTSDLNLDPIFCSSPELSLALPLRKILEGSKLQAAAKKRGEQNLYWLTVSVLQPVLGEDIWVFWWSVPLVIVTQYGIVSSPIKYLRILDFCNVELANLFFNEHFKIQEIIT